MIAYRRRMMRPRSFPPVIWRLHETGFRDLNEHDLCGYYVQEMAQCVIPARLGSALSPQLGDKCLVDYLICNNAFEYFLGFNVVLDDIEVFPVGQKFLLKCQMHQDTQILVITHY